MTPCHPSHGGILRRLPHPPARTPPDRAPGSPAPAHSAGLPRVTIRAFHTRQPLVEPHHARMTRHITATLLATLTLSCATACTSTTPAPVAAESSTPAIAPTSPAPATSTPQNAAAALMAKLTAAVPQAQQIADYTETTDPNHLLGRPNQYTAKVEFKDTRIDTSAVSGVPAASVQFGGSIEVFASAADAASRMAGLHTNTASDPLLLEYDYQRGSVVVRVSHYVTPSQAKAYAAFVAGLPTSG